MLTKNLYKLFSRQSCHIIYSNIIYSRIIIIWQNVYLIPQMSMVKCGMSSSSLAIFILIFISYFSFYHQIHTHTTNPLSCDRVPLNITGQPLSLLLTFKPHTCCFICSHPKSHQNTWRHFGGKRNKKLHNGCQVILFYVWY